ncbi:PP2C family protein-serine/threonine phosphatase [Blastococcus sp. SYSU D00669]
MTTGTPPRDRDPVRSLLRASHHLPADRLGAVVTDRASMLGAREAVVYLADYEQQSLVPVQGQDTPARAPLGVERSVGGRAFRRVQVVRSGATTLWVPLLDGAERVGVLELVFDGDVDAELEDECRSYASLVAELTVTRDAYSDVFARLRRDRTMDLAAELQWDLLPPLTYGTQSVVISGALEPSYEIGGDTFDYAVNGPVAELMVLDAVGHGMPAALLATAAIAAYRAGRRRRLPLPEVATLMDGVISGQFAGSQFATAVLARLDLDTGHLRWINAGHPPPLIVRNGHLVRPGARPPARPLGLQHRPPDESSLHLQPGDRLILYTDGIVEARSPAGEFFGEERLADLVVRAESAGDPPPETLRRLMASVMEHQAGRLQDDATIVLAEWRTGREDQLRL